MVVSFLRKHRKLEDKEEQKNGKPQTAANDENDENAKAKETKLLWFKPIDKRHPLIAIPIHSAPPDFLENEKAFENMIMTVSVDIHAD